MRTDHGGGHSRIFIVGQLVQILPEGLILTPEDVEVFMESVHHCCEAGTTRAFTPGRRLLHTRRRRHLVVLAACSTPAVLLAVDCHCMPAALDRADALDRGNASAIGTVLVELLLDNVSLSWL